MNMQSNNSKDLVIWRYLDLQKFMSLIVQNKLFFTRADNLLKDDPRECIFTSKDLELIRTSFDDQFLILNESKRQSFNEESASQLIVDLRAFFLKSIAVNCWHISLHQSMAMWKIYSAKNGVVIKSSQSRLLNSLNNENRYYEANNIKYIDYTTYKILPNPQKIHQLAALISNDQNLLFDQTYLSSLLQYFLPLLFHKTRSFKEENEHRIFTFMNYPEGENYFSKTGESCDVDLNTLIDEIHLPPYTESWIYNDIFKFLEKYNLSHKLTNQYQSSILC